MSLRATTNILRRGLRVLALATALPAWAQGALEVITLQHRTADQVIPVLQPLLDAGGALSGQYNQLIVRTSPANLAQIRQVLASIDRPQRRLSISVRFDSVRDTARSAQDEQVDQRLQVLEGGQAYISAGETRPYAQANSGFSVVPRVSGDTVSLEIAAQQEAFARGGAIRGQQASSTVSGRLGEWLELGGTSSAAAASRRIWVKVEELP